MHITRFKYTIIAVLAVGVISLSSFIALSDYTIDESRVITHVVSPLYGNLKFYWQDKDGNNINSFANLNSMLEKENKTLYFAMNGGMFMKDFTPLGLYIENGKTLRKVNTTQEAYGNFYLQPNGIFYLTKDKKAVVCKTTDFKASENILYATQSGPMLLIDGAIHTAFKKGSKNLHIRNAVGILPDGNILFVISKELINFYDLATFFKQEGCKNALYLDGFVSKTYLPTKDCVQEDGNFGVIIGQTRATGE